MAARFDRRPPAQEAPPAPQEPQEPQVTQEQMAEEVSKQLDERGVVDRAWTSFEVPAERARDTIYTNETGADIVVQIRSTPSSTTASLALDINPQSASLRRVLESGNIGTILGHRQTLTAIVPKGAQYRLRQRDADQWLEYRPV